MYMVVSRWFSDQSSSGSARGATDAAAGIGENGQWKGNVLRGVQNNSRPAFWAPF